MDKTWQLQTAKNRFSAVVDAALEGEAQIVTRHGKAAAVVLSFEEYSRLKALERVQNSRNALELLLEHSPGLSEAEADSLFARVPSETRLVEFE